MSTGSRRTTILQKGAAGAGTREDKRLPPRGARLSIKARAWIARRRQRQPPRDHHQGSTAPTPDGEPFAIAGVWRPTAEWGDAYAMVMADSCDAMAAVHTRMPVVLRREERRRWVEGTPTEASKLCQPWATELTVERTTDPWQQHAPVDPPQPPGLFG